MIQVICLNEAHKKREFLFPRSPDSGLTAVNKNLNMNVTSTKKKSNCVQWCTSAAVCVRSFLCDFAKSNRKCRRTRRLLILICCWRPCTDSALFSCFVCWCKYGEKSIYMNKSWFRFIHIRWRGCCLNVIFDVIKYETIKKNKWYKFYFCKKMKWVFHLFFLFLVLVMQCEFSCFIRTFLNFH